MEFKATFIAGLFEIILPKFDDERGCFIKTFHFSNILEKTGLDFEIKESYFSISQKDVIRGMHFQLPPHDHHKIVFCPQGKIIDVVLDIRKHSNTYGQFFETELSPENHKALLIPKGCAHGFQSLKDNSITYYLVTSEYNKDADSGIKYDSFGKEWHIPNPIISNRDLSFDSL